MMADEFPLRSTGQTAADLVGLELIGNITGWNMSYHPAETNPDYAPPNAGKPVPFIVVCVLAASLAMVYVRLVTTQRHRRTRMKAMLFLEDWLIVLALILIIGLCGLSLTGYYRWQWGWHGWDVRLRNYVWNYKIFYIWFVINLWASCAIRASLVLTVRRMYSPLKTKLLHVCDFLLGLKVLLVIGGTLGITFACGVNLDILDVYLWSEKCDDAVYTLALCAGGILLDLSIITLPIPLVFKLKRLTKRKKIEVCVMFSLGFLAVGASCVRMYCFTSPVDPNCNAAYLAIASLIELCVSLCTTCIPSARVLFARLYCTDRSLFDVKAYFRKESIAEPLFAFAATSKAHCPAQRCIRAAMRKRTSRVVYGLSGNGVRGSEIRMSRVNDGAPDNPVFQEGVDKNAPDKDQDYDTFASSSSKVKLDYGDEEKGANGGSGMPRLPGKALTVLGRHREEEGVRISISATCEEEDDEMDGELVLLPEPSDAFFPWATALSPRPTPSRR